MARGFFKPNLHHDGINHLRLLTLIKIKIDEQRLQQPSSLSTKAFVSVPQFFQTMSKVLALVPFIPFFCVLFVLKYYVVENRNL